MSHFTEFFNGPIISNYLRRFNTGLLFPHFSCALSSPLVPVSHEPPGSDPGTSVPVYNHLVKSFVTSGRKFRTLRERAYSLLGLIETDRADHFVNWINIPRPRPITQANLHHRFRQAVRQGNLEGLFFGSKRLDACVPYKPQLVLGAQNHLSRAGIGCLRRVNPGCLKYCFSVRAFGGHVQDHLSFRRSPVGNAVTGLARYLCLYNHHGKELSFGRMECVGQSLHIHG